MQIDNSKIFIISSPRVGSTALLAYLKKMLGATYSDIIDFSEPYYLRNSNPEYLINMKNCVTLKKNFIIKIHHWNFKSYDQTIINYLLTSPEVFRIQLLRKDVVAQISSFYIATMRNKRYHFYKGQSNYNDTIPLIDEILRECTERILLYNKNLLEEKIDYNLRLNYEDLPEMNNVPNIITPKPVNHDNIKNAIVNLIENKLYTTSAGYAHPANFKI